VKMGDVYLKETKPIRRTAHPKFNEKFEIPVRSQNCHVNP